MASLNIIVTFSYKSPKNDFPENDIGFVGKSLGLAKHLMNKNKSNLVKIKMWEDPEFLCRLFLIGCVTLFQFKIPESWNSHLYSAREDE